MQIPLRARRSSSHEWQYQSRGQGTCDGKITEIKQNTIYQQFGTLSLKDPSWEATDMGTYTESFSSPVEVGKQCLVVDYHSDVAPE